MIRRLVYIILMIQLNTKVYAESSKSIQTCLACHGQSSSMDVPNIFGQQKKYLVKQLTDFKYNHRINVMMNQITQSLTYEEIDRIADYFSNQNWNYSIDQIFNEKKIHDGYLLVQSVRCTSCHGLNLQGFSTTPRLAGQKNDYLQKELKKFQSLSRRNDLGLMYAVTQLLDDDEIESISNYLSSLKDN